MKTNRGVSAIPLILLWTCFGCQPPQGSNPASQSTTAADKIDEATSRSALTIDDARPNAGQREITEEIEREIYKSLNHRRKMMAAIRRNSGSQRGIQQMQDELGLLSRGFMNRYQFTEADIETILNKGDANGWE